MKTRIFPILQVHSEIIVTDCLFFPFSYLYLNCINFTDFIKESDRGLYHGWQRLSEQEEEKEDEA
jgi:hypothetical protein